MLPTVEISELVPEELPIQIREPVEADGNISLVEIAVISKLVKSRNPAAIFEIGTFDGRTTLNMAANSPPDTRIYTLDLPSQSKTELPIDRGEEKYIDKDASGARFIGTDCESKITQLYGDSATFDFSPYHDTADMIFVDGAHSYEYVLHDSRRALKLLRDGKGLILWHDYDKVWWIGLTQRLERTLYGTKRIRRRDAHQRALHWSALSCNVMLTLTYMGNVNILMDLARSTERIAEDQANG